VSTLDLVGAALALVLAVALALLMRRDARAFPVLAVLALPFRIPVSADARTVNLLVPLYVVVAAGALALLAPRVLRREALFPHGPAPLDWLLLGTVALYALQTIYSGDHVKGAENLAFFYVPFALLYVLLRQAPWTRELLLVCLGVAVAEALVFAGIGFVEYGRKELLLNPKIVAANQYDNYFRVNSLFFDPSIYGRFLALVTIAVTTVVLWARGRREVWAGAAVLAWLMGGLITSFSQSSIAALLLGLAVLAAWRWDVRSTVYVALALGVIAAVAVLVAPPGLHIGLSGSGGSANNATNGRAKLVTRGLSLFADRPLQGYGSGSFAKEYLAHNNVTSENATSASHTIPITVAAEQGIVGLALYVALLVVSFTALFRGAGRSPPRIALAACYAALVLHTWTYADFLEDPMTWTLLGIGAALAFAPRAPEGELAALAGRSPRPAPPAAGAGPGDAPPGPAPDLPVAPA
jgi:O-antigen ligase